MKPQPNYYQVLHVQPDAPAALIRASFRTLMQNLGMHPDLGGAHEQAVLINEAYATLSDPDRRADYDRTLTATSTDTSRAARPTDRTPRRPAPSGHQCAFCGAGTPATRLAGPDSLCHGCASPLFPAVKHQAGDSRRSLERLPRHMPLTLRRAVDRHRSYPGTTEDISLHGARVASAAPVTVGDRVSLDCDFCTAVAVVKNVAPLAVPGSLHTIGVEFLTLRLKHLRGGLVSTVA